MICPHCLKTIDDTETFCPHCHGYVGSASSSEFVFCDGCGARLSAHDRTCPKCGRPAPGILSVESASSDLAAGRTASFPRLTKSAIQTEAPQVEPASAARTLDDSVDPSATNVLNLEDIQRAAGVTPQPVGEDPYHPARRSHARLIGALIVIAVLAGAAAFVVYDPLGVMPGFYDSFKSAAREAFPSRQLAESGSATVAAPAGESETPADDDDERVLTDDEVYLRVTEAYDQLAVYDSDEAIGEVIDSFNSYYLEPDLAERTQRSQTAYELRDAVQQTIDDLDAIVCEPDCAYLEDLEHVRQLAEWFMGRVDQICASWDVSLAIPEGESTLAAQDDILQPMREAGSSDLENFDAHFYEWDPRSR